MANFSKGKDWESVPAYGTGESVALKKGGYVCKIRGAKLETYGGRAAIVLAFDIAEGEFAGYYENLFESRKKTDKNVKWGGTYIQFMVNSDGSTNPFFKGMITSIEKSNNFTLPNEFTDNDLKGKLFGAVFGREEFEKNDGSTGWATRATAIRSVDAIRKGDFTVPEDKALVKKPANNYKTESVTDEELPF